MVNNILAVLMISLMLLLATVASAMNLNVGVSQYEWGESASKYDGLSKLGTKGEVIYYAKPGETYTIGDVSIENVVYGFYQDQLFGVYLDIESIEIYDKLLAHMKSLYGLPATKTASANSVVHKWKHKDVTIKLKTNEPGRKMKLAFYYRQISSDLNSPQYEDLDTSTLRFVPFEKDKKREKFILFEF